MKLGILLSTFVVALVAMVAFSFFETAGASQGTQQVVPIVNVDSTALLSIVSGTDPGNNDAIDFGNMAAGSTQTKTLVLGITANDAWQLTVSKGQDLKCSDVGQPGYNEIILSADFTFTSSAGTPAPAGTPTYVASDTEFGTAGTPANVVVCDSTTSQSSVQITYKLTVPADQPIGYYSAPHTYTLIVGE